MAKKTVKEFVQEHKKGILLTTGLVVGTVIGGTVMYVLTRDARALVDNLKELGVCNGEFLYERINRYAKSSNAAYFVERDKSWPVKEIGRLSDSMLECAADMDFLDAEILGSVVFTKIKGE